MDYKMEVLMKKLICLQIILCLNFSALAKSEGVKLKGTNLSNNIQQNQIVNEAYYRQAQREYRRKNFNESIKLFEHFVVDNKSMTSDYAKERVFWSVDLVVRTQLRINKDPDAAISFLNRISKIIHLNEAESDIISE